MAYQKYSGYQYDTNPRKLEPEYDIPKNPYKQKKTVTKVTKKVNNKKGKREETRKKTKTIILVAFAFSILFAISYRNSMITRTFNEKQTLEARLGSIEKENAQLRVGIEKSLNLSSIEQAAKTQLGMRKLDNTQKKYISLDKKDYIEPATEDVITEEDGNLWANIVNTIGNIFK